jgi:hypothetical protein
MGSFLVDEATYSADSFVFDRSMSSVNYNRISTYPKRRGRNGRLPLKIDALMANMAIPPAMTSPPSPNVPRGSFGGLPPPAPRCLIISRRLKQSQSRKEGVLPIHRITGGHDDPWRGKGSTDR